MAVFDPYPPGSVEEIVASSSNYFGLIGNSEVNQDELHGYEVTMSGRLVLPELRPQTEDEAQQAGGAIGQC